jgi:hypothetical protein
MRETRNAYEILTGKPEGKRPLRGLRGVLREIDLENVDWIHVAQDRNRWRPVVKTTMNLRVSIKYGEFID